MMCTYVRSLSDLIKLQYLMQIHMWVLIKLYSSVYMYMKLKLTPYKSNPRRRCLLKALVHVIETFNNSNSSSLKQFSFPFRSFSV